MNMPDPAPPAGTFFLSPPILIDLTESDNENNGQDVSPSRRNRQPQQYPDFFPHDIPLSNHGLILPGTFFDVANGLNGSNGIDHAQTVQEFGGVQPSRSAAPGFSQFHLAQKPTPRRTYVSGKSTNRRSTGSYIIRPEDRTQLSNASSTLNPAKRRKAEGAIIQQSNNIFPPIRPPQFQNGYSTAARRLLQPALVAGIPQSQSGQSGQEDLAPPHQESTYLPRHQNAIPVAKENERKLQDVAGKRVLQHIRTAMQKHRNSLPRDEQTKIARDTANKLLSSPSFYEKFTTNTWTVDYDQELLMRAQAHVDGFAKFLLNSLSKISHGKNGSSGQDMDSMIVTSEIRQLRRRNNTRHERQRSSSNETTEDDQIFEPFPEPRREKSVILPPQIQRHYSSSPTTSYSTELPDSVSLAERRHMVDTGTASPTLEIVIRSQTSQPSERSQQARRKVKDKPSDRAHSSEKSQVLNRSNLISNRQVQRSRLAALDPIIERPYLNSIAREEVQRGIQVVLSSRQQHFSLAEVRSLAEVTVHVDFCHEEMAFVYKVIRTVVSGGPRPVGLNISQHVTALMKGQESKVDRISTVAQLAVKNPANDVERAIKIRGKGGIRAFLEDAAAGKLLTNTSCIYIGSPSVFKPSLAVPKQRISTLLNRREIWGMDPVGVRRNHLSFKEEFSNHLEDSLLLQSEWTDCCGDISSFSWTSYEAFVCGATAHSDFHNQQYNKPGNLLVGSSSRDTLRSIADHRIARPIVSIGENAENALESMRQTQDPWLYTSVVSTAHNDLNCFTFTASFDRTVKVWEVAEDGSSMDLRGSWDHDGKVNFVVTSEQHQRVATASDVSSSAIRVYNFDQDDVAGSPYDTYDCDKSHAQAQEPHAKGNWAYFPATIAWGRGQLVKDQLLVGYSPRSLTGDEGDIPEDKRNSGELCLWNVENGERVQISSARTQNVFEVLWHPDHPMFLAATSPAGVYDSKTKTQIRIFTLGDLNTFGHIKTLDCAASDVNELTIRPYSEIEMYVTASCTDGKVYVWDTSQGDRPIHVLGHGESLDNPIHDIPREDADTGVKFTAWGRTLSRLYTGSSDGKVYAWNVENSKGNSFVRTVLKVSGGVCAGAFSKDYSKLVIGDATGKVHLLAIKQEELEDNAEALPEVPVRELMHGFAAKLPARAVKNVPRVVIPHPEPPVPAEYENRLVVEKSGKDTAQTFLEEGQLSLHPNRLIGAVQGPNYSETLFYRYEAHLNNDGTKLLLPDWQAQQQFEIRLAVPDLVVPRLPAVKKSSMVDHLKNVEMDFDFARLSSETQKELERDRVDLGFPNEHTFEFEVSPRKKIFRTPKSTENSQKYISASASVD